MTDQDAYGESVEVSWPLDETTVYGTLLRPSGPGPFRGVVMVAGSGPTDRDWNSPLLPGTNGSARLIAAALARAGIASLRYDKRASGPHVRENLPALIGKMSMQSHLDELAGAVRTLAGQEDIRADRIFALTNSEGALHALNYQVRGPAIPFAGLALIGPPGRPVGAVARSQLAAQAAGLPNGDALMALYDAAIARFLAGEPVASDPALPEAFQMLLRSSGHAGQPAVCPRALDCRCGAPAPAGGRPGADRHRQEGSPGGLASRRRETAAGRGGTGASALPLSGERQPRPQARAAAPIGVGARRSGGKLQ